MQNYILYLAHSHPRYINECRFSLLKYLAVYNLNPPATTAIVVYTDQPQLFEAFIPFFNQFHIIPIGSRELKDWQGAKGAAPRIKPAVMQHFVATHSGHMLFLDTDTYITEPLEPIWSRMETGAIFLHQSEGVLQAQANAAYKKWDAILQSHAIAYGQKTLAYTANLQLWNTGAVGLSSSQVSVVTDTLALTDALYLLLAEKQAASIAYSYCLGRAAAVKDLAETVVHYNQLKEFDVLLRLFFKKNEEESIPNLVKLSHALNPKLIGQEKQQYQELPFYKRWLLALTGKGWHIRQYQHKI